MGTQQQREYEDRARDLLGGDKHPRHRAEDVGVLAPKLFPPIVAGLIRWYILQSGPGFGSVIPLFTEIEKLAADNGWKVRTGKDGFREAYKKQ